MRLINVKTLKFESFLEISLPPYAILSHTWGDNELEFQQWQASPDTSSSGYKKILGACTQAERDGIGHCWVDTVCIDKTSSAELQEAINSMYAWYEHAKICYAYLSDVPYNTDPLEANSQFRNSKWFTRGWTLQELLAPRDLVFYAENWREVGNKADLAYIVSQVTNISILKLIDLNSVRQTSLAEKMSWASNRITTRLEDAAYCLLGIFEVNMPMLYGEGSRAFLRLQEEIIKKYNDETIFAWTWIPQLTPRALGQPRDPRPNSDEIPIEINCEVVQFPSRRLQFITSHPFWTYHGGSSMLAPDPANFFASSRFKPLSRRAPPFSLTNAGLYIYMDIFATEIAFVRQYDLGDLPRVRYWAFARLQCSHGLRPQEYVCVPITRDNTGHRREGWPASPVPISSIAHLSSPEPLYFVSLGTTYDPVELKTIKEMTRRWGPHHSPIHGLLFTFSTGYDKIKRFHAYRLHWSGESLEGYNLAPEDNAEGLIFCEKEWATVVVIGFDLTSSLTGEEIRHRRGLIFCTSEEGSAPDWRCRIVPEDRVFRGEAVDEATLREELGLLRAATVGTQQCVSADYLTVCTGKPILVQQAFTLSVADIYLHEGRKGVVLDFVGSSEVRLQTLSQMLDSKSV